MIEYSFEIEYCGVGNQCVYVHKSKIDEHKTASVEFEFFISLLLYFVSFSVLFIHQYR